MCFTDESNPLGVARISEHISHNNAQKLRIHLISKGNDRVLVQKRFDTISKILFEEISRLKGEIVNPKR